MNSICTVCPKGCNISNINGNITGNQCTKGIDYILSMNSRREYTGTISVRSEERTRLPFKTDKEIDINLFGEIREEVSKIELEKPIYIGDIVYENILDTGVNLVSTKNLV